MRQIARKLNKVELRFFVRVRKFDAGGLTPGKENLCAMKGNMQADDVQRRKPRVVRCCLKHPLKCREAACIKTNRKRHSPVKAVPKRFGKVICRIISN